MSVFANLKNSLPPLMPDPSQGPLLTMPDDSGAAQTQLQKISASVPKPSVVFAPTPQQQIQDHLQGNLNRDYQKDLHPWGTEGNHPGVFGKIMHGLNVATGGETRRGWEEQGLEKRLNDLAAENARNDYENAETAHTKEETQEMPGKTQSEEDFQGATTRNLESETRDRDKTASYGPPLATAYAHAVNDALKNGRDPSADPIVQHLSDAITSIQKPVAPKGAHFIQREEGGVPHTVAVDDVTGQDIRDEGPTGEKPPTVNVNAGNAELDREAGRLGKGWDTANTQADAQLEKIADARAMVNGNAESQALGLPKVLTALVSGQGSGVRITQAELNMIGKARGLEGDVQGALNKWAGQGQLTATQKQQLTQILDDVKARIIEKQNIASRALDTINGATDRQGIVKADKLARQQMSELERYGHYSGQDVMLNGKTVTIQKIHPDGTFEY